MGIVTAILSFLGSLVSALPKILEQVREWRNRRDAEADRTAKDERNRKAVSDAASGAGPRP